MKYVEFEAQIFNYKVTLLIKSTSTLNFSSIGLIIKQLGSNNNYSRLRIRTCGITKEGSTKFCITMVKLYIRTYQIAAI